jgi:hypothetical protein
MMTFEDFLATLEQDTPDASLPPLLQALWYEARGDWDRAHKITQKDNNADAFCTFTARKVIWAMPGTGIHVPSAKCPTIHSKASGAPLPATCSQGDAKWRTSLPPRAKPLTAEDAENAEEMQSHSIQRTRLGR